jgi:hypothetical protein
MSSLDFLLTGCSEPEQVTRLRELRALVAVYCGDRLPALRRRRLLPSYGTLSVGGSGW